MHRLPDYFRNCFHLNKIKHFQSQALVENIEVTCGPLRCDHRPPIRVSIKLRKTSFLGSPWIGPLGTPQYHLSASKASDKIFSTLQISLLCFQCVIGDLGCFVSAIIGKRGHEKCQGEGFSLYPSLNEKVIREESLCRLPSKKQMHAEQKRAWI